MLGHHRSGTPHSGPPRTSLRAAGERTKPSRAVARSPSAPAPHPGEGLQCRPRSTLHAASTTLICIINLLPYNFQPSRAGLCAAAEVCTAYMGMPGGRATRALTPARKQNTLSRWRVRRPECTPCRCFECGSSAAESTPRPAQRPPPRHYRTLSVQPRQEVREPERLGGWRARLTQRRLGCLPRTALTPVRQLSQRRSCSSGFKLKTRAVSAQSFVGRGT